MGGWAQHDSLIMLYYQGQPYRLSVPPIVLLSQCQHTVKRVFLEIELHQGLWAALARRLLDNMQGTPVLLGVSQCRVGSAEVFWLVRVRVKGAFKGSNVCRAEHSILCCSAQAQHVACHRSQCTHLGVVEQQQLY
jgi:hypothetical protein